MKDKIQRVIDDINSSGKQVKTLYSDDSVRKEIQERYQINSESLLGIILENFGGIIIDNWIRLYGSGKINFISRNELFPFDELVIAEDILGGLFIYLKNGNIGYFAPDCLEIEDMNIHYNQFLYWCLHGDTDTFYNDFRWQNWRNDISDIDYNDGVAFYPFLWAKADNNESRARNIIPISEIIGLEFDFLRQLQKNSNFRCMI